MSYLALYRKYRPKIFDDMHGQDINVKILKNEIIHNRISHAYLFSGPRGTGKTSTARIFSKAINCLNPINGNPCCTCDICKQIDDKTIGDVIEIDAASNNGVDQIRSLIEESKYSTHLCKYKIYIIDEVHMLSKQAFDSLLKTLEEPSKNVIFILATTEYNKVPETILSRCQKFNFTLINNDIIKNNLKNICDKENIKYTETSLESIANAGNGSMRDSISLLDQIIQVSNNEITDEDITIVLGKSIKGFINDLINYIDNNDIKNIINELHNIYNEGISLVKLFESLFSYYKNKLYENYDEKYYRYIDIIANMLESIRYEKSNHTVLLNSEIALIRLTKPVMQSDYFSLCERVKELEKIVYSNNHINKNTNNIDFSQFVMLPYSSNNCSFKLHII